MKTRILLTLALPIFLLAILAGAASGGVDPKKSGIKDPLPVDGALSARAGVAPSPVVYGAKVSNCEEIYPQVPTAPVATVGFTYYDYQKNGSMGRMIAVGPGGHRHFIFHETRGDYTVFPRYITYNCTDGAGYWVGPTWLDGGEDINAGYANIMTTHDGREIILYHRQDTPQWHTSLLIGDEGYICTGYFTNMYDLPDVIDGYITAPNGYWPKGCVMYDAVVDTDYIHIISTESTGGTEEQTFSYQRCNFQGDNLVCRSPGYGPYTRMPNTAYPSPLEKIAVVDTVMTISAIIVTSPVTRKVAIVYTKNRDDFATQVNNDVVYIESWNNGNDWLADPNWKYNRVNITNYATTDLERAYTDVAACYDYNDNLHIVWNAAYYDSVTGNATYECNLYHWTDATYNITMIASGYWDNTAPGGWNRNISKMSVAVKDPIYHPGGDPDSVFLFATWTQFNSGDLSAGGWSNGDIYAAVSNDGGEMWAPGVNLTNTPSPGCPAGECASDHWSSLAENMYDGDLHVQYVCDRDAGGIVKDEGVWTDNDVMYLHVYQLPLETACGIIWSSGEPSSFTVPPIKVSPDKGSRVVTFDITGLYNLGGDFEVTSDHPNVAITGNSSGYLSPGETKTVEVTINCQYDGFINVTITVRGCIGTENETTIEISLYAVCSNDYYECARAPNTSIEKDNGKIRLWVCSNSGQQLWHNWIQPEENQQVIFYGGTFVATIAADDPSDTVIGRQDYKDVYTGARDTINVLEFDDPEGGCRIQRIQVKDTYIWKTRFPDALRWYWIDIYKQMFMFHDNPPAECPFWKKDIIVKHVKTKFSQPPLWWPSPGDYPGHEDIYLGHWADVDAPFDEGCNGCNTAGYDDPREMVWLHGFTNDTLEEQHPEYENFYVGLAFTDTLGAVVEPLGMQCVRNDTFLYPQDGWGWRTDQFYDLITTAGENIQDPDSVVDRSVVMTSGMIPAGEDTTFEADYILIEAAVQGDPGTGLAELQAHMDDARGILIPLLDSLGLLSWDVEFMGDCGDLNNDGMVDGGDIVILVNYLFLGYPLPPWPERADVNGDYNIDGADYVYLVNYIFLLDPPALNCPGFPGHTPPSWGDDPLNPDSIRLRVEDCKLTPKGTDIDVTVWSSNDEALQAIVFPLSWSEDAYLDPAKNSLSAGSEYYIFRDYDGVPNRLRPYVESASDLLFFVDSLNNQSLFFIKGPGYESSNLPPGSGLFGTLVFTCDQPTAPLIDTCFFPPCHHLLFIEPDCNYFVPHFGSWEPVDCSRSYSDPCLVACPLGDIPFRVYLKDSKGTPVTNYSNVWLDFSGCSVVVHCPAETYWPIVPPDGPSDENGVITFHVRAGGCNNSCQVSVMAGCGLIGYVSVKTVDLNGDLVVKADDWHNIGGDLCNDYNCNEEVNFWDLDFFRDHILHSCEPDPCLLLSQDLTMHPDTLLPVDSTHAIRLFITNHHSEPCTAQFVKFYHHGFVQDPGLIQFATRYLWQELMPGDTISTEADFVVPGPDTGYVLTKFYTDCCDHSIDAIASPVPRMCPPDSMVYVFPIVLDIVPAYVETLEYLPDELGWYWFLYYTGGTPDSLAVVTPDSSVLGVTGGVTLYFFDQDSTLLSYRTCEVRITLNSGDVNSDCLVDVADVICLINYLFLGGSAPNPVRAGDVNCDCLLDVADVIYLINYLFLGGSPPVSSETCECGY